MAEKSFLLELRDAAKSVRDPTLRTALRRAADLLAHRLGELSLLESRGNMTMANSAWGHAQRLLWMAEKETDDSGGGGSIRQREPEMLEAKAA